MRPFRALLLVLALWASALVISQLLACELARATASEEQRPAMIDPSPVENDPAPTKQHRALRPEATPDPYRGWSRWCEPEQLPACKTVADCKDVVHPSGRPLKCVQPWYAEAGSDLRVCSPGFSNRFERDHQRARIRELVRLQYSGEAELCEDDDGWRCGARKVRGDHLAALLNMVAQRETTMRYWKRHRLNGDIRANRWAWHRTAKAYGHDYGEKPRRSRERTPIVFIRGGNRHFQQQHRWEYGLGLYGMNAALFTRNWSRAAPPEVLCREVEATEVYLRSARRAWRKLAGGIDCDGKPGREWFGVAGSPTWYDVHHYASGGKLCPSKKSLANFEKVAKKIGLPAFAKVSLAELGEPIAADGQNVTARLLAARLDVFSTLWLGERG